MTEPTEQFFRWRWDSDTFARREVTIGPLTLHSSHAIRGDGVVLPRRTMLLLGSWRVSFSRSWRYERDKYPLAPQPTDNAHYSP